MKLDSLICIARETLSVLDEFPDLTLSHPEILAAAKAGELVDHLNKRFREKPHLPVLLGKTDERLSVNHSLRRALGHMERHENRRTRITRSGSDLLIALTLDAIPCRAEAMRRRGQHYVEPCPAVALRH